MSRHGKAEWGEGAMRKWGILPLNCCQVTEISFSGRLWEGLQFLGTESTESNGRVSHLYSCRSDMVIAREAGRTKKLWGTGWEDGNVRLQSTDLILEDIRHCANRRERFFSVWKKERPSVKVTAWIVDYGEQYFSLLTYMEMLLRMSSAHIWLSNFPLDVG